MLTYVLIGLSLVLTGIAGFQFLYMFYVETMSKMREQHVKQLEAKCSSLQRSLDSAVDRISEQNQLLTRLGFDVESDEEHWADVIHDA